MTGHCRAWLALAACALPGTFAFAQLRIATWNVTTYGGGRVTEFQTAAYGVFEGRSLSPDIVIGQEFTSQAGVDAFLSLLNAAPGSPGDWAAAPYIDGNDTDNAFFYRTSKVQFLALTTIQHGSGPPNPPRDVQRYDIRPVGYDAAAATLACYSSHMKAGDSTDDQARRLLEAEAIRGDAELLSPEWHFLLGGDFNIQSSGQAAYVELTGSQANNAGRFFDPIATPGSWNNNVNFRFVHTQDPIGAGGMDDRHDQILLSDSLIDGEGFDYVGDPTLPYSTTTWDDVNHSYRAWGNDGTSYNSNLRVSGNTMVGPVIAQALIDAAGSAGHLPVYLELRVPAEIDAPLLVDFGTVQLGDPAQQMLTVSNAGDSALWTDSGIADLEYSLSASAGFSAPGGTFVEPAGGAGKQHVLTMDTSTAGTQTGTLTIASNAPDEPARVVVLTGVVQAGGCPGDLDHDGDVDLSDLSTLLANFGLTGVGPEAGDLDGDADVDLSDLSTLLASFGLPC